MRKNASVEEHTKQSFQSHNKKSFLRTPFCFHIWRDVADMKYKDGKKGDVNFVTWDSEPVLVKRFYCLLDTAMEQDRHQILILV